MGSKFFIKPTRMHAKYSIFRDGIPSFRCNLPKRSYKISICLKKIDFNVLFYKIYLRIEIFSKNY